MAARSLLTALLPPVLGCIAGLSASVAIAAAPDGLAERLVGWTMFLPSGSEPLGTISRTIAALCGGACTTAAVWLALQLLLARAAARHAARKAAPLLPMHDAAADGGAGTARISTSRDEPSDLRDEPVIEALLRRLEVAARR